LADNAEIQRNYTLKGGRKVVREIKSGTNVNRQVDEYNNMGVQ
jgi:hypothetical protein